MKRNQSKPKTKKRKQPSKSVSPYVARIKRFQQLIRSEVSQIDKSKQVDSLITSLAVLCASTAEGAERRARRKAA